MNAATRYELSDYFGRKPVIVNFVYYKCRDLCPLLLDGLVRLAASALSFDIGKPVCRAHREFRSPRQRRAGGRQE